MTEQSGPLNGKCLCGAVRFRAAPESRHVEACHCTMCRAWGGTAFLGIQCGTEIEIEGEDRITRFRSSEWAERGFCGSCGSNLFYHYIPLGTYSFAAGLFADDALEPLSEEIFIDEKPPYYAFAGDSRKMTGAEVMAEYGVGENEDGG